MNLDILDGKSVLVTGGTGSFGNEFVKLALRNSKIARLVILSRDEWKQSEMSKKFDDPRIRFFLGDIRDGQRLQRAFRGIDIVIHSAALKQVPTLEYNPFEAVLTNVIGGQNIINAAIDQGVSKVVALSTDKAANPVNLYGATKLCAEKLFTAGNAYSGKDATRFSVVRYGNVVGSRGSVIPLFKELRKTGTLPITDDRMTRFWITLEEAVGLVIHALNDMHGGEIYVPKIPSMKVADLAKAIGPECERKVVGIRPGEKLHEVLLTEDEAVRADDTGRYFVIRPHYAWTDNGKKASGTPLPDGFRYASDTNKEWLSEKELGEMAEAA